VFNLFSKGKIPKRWQSDSLRALIDVTDRAEILAPSPDDPRVRVTAPENADWTPRHHRFAGNVLVIADIQFAGKDPNTAEVYKAYVESLETIADWRLPVSQLACAITLCLWSTCSTARPSPGTPRMAAPPRSSPWLPMGMSPWLPGDDEDSA
jgi:hypothetical protein